MTRRRKPRLVPRHWTEIVEPGGVIETKEQWDLFIATASEDELQRALDEVTRMTVEAYAERGLDYFPLASLDT